MPATLQVPASFQPVTGKAEVKVSGNTIELALQDFAVHYPELAERLFKDEVLRPFVHVYLNDEEITYLKGPATPVHDGDHIVVIPTVGESA